MSSSVWFVRFQAEIAWKRLELVLLKWTGFYWNLYQKLLPPATGGLYRPVRRPPPSSSFFLPVSSLPVSPDRLLCINITSRRAGQYKACYRWPGRNISAIRTAVNVGRHISADTERHHSCRHTLLLILGSQSLALEDMASSSEVAHCRALYICIYLFWFIYLRPLSKFS